jgi:hypothetical protein
MALNSSSNDASDESHTEIKIYFMFNNIFSVLAIYEIMCNNMAEPDRSQMTICHGPCALHAG